MDTDITNYTYDEILNVLHLSGQITHEVAYGKTVKMVNKIKGSEGLDEDTTNEYVAFFWECFQRVASQEKLNEFEQDRERLLERQREIRDNEIVHKELYPGALPKGLPETVVVNSNTTEYERGLVNPIKRETIKNTLIGSSKFASGNSSTDFSVNLNEPLTNVVALKVAGLELANFFYNISKYLGNWHFTIHTYLRDTITDEISNRNSNRFEFQDGYYNMDTFTANLQSQMDANPNTTMITTSYNILKGKLNFILNPIPPVPPPANKAYEFDLDFANNVAIKYYEIGWYLGYVKNYYTFKNNYSNGIDLNQDIGYNPERSLDFSGTKFFLLEVTDFNNNAPQVLLYNTKYNSSDLMAKIPNASTLANIIYDDSSDRIFKTRKYFGPIKLQKLRIRLLDEYGIVVHLNNADFSLTFEVESLDVPYKNLV